MFEFTNIGSIAIISTKSNRTLSKIKKQKESTKLYKSEYTAQFLKYRLEMVLNKETAKLYRKSKMIFTNLNFYSHDNGNLLFPVLYYKKTGESGSPILVMNEEEEIIDILVINSLKEVGSMLVNVNVVLAVSILSGKLIELVDEQKEDDSYHVNTYHIKWFKTEEDDYG